MVAATAAQRVPGTLVLVVGPSGAGKDSLIRAAREALGGDERFAFPRRVVTRPPSEAEDNENCDPDAFARGADAGRFAVTWSAHGHSYGIPATVEASLEAGCSVVCNVSRTVVGAMRARFPRVVVVEVTASAAVLAARVAARDRAGDGDPVARATRRVDPAGRPDALIRNEARLEDACTDFMRVLMGTRPPGDLATDRARAVTRASSSDS